MPVSGFTLIHASSAVPCGHVLALGKFEPAGADLAPAMKAAFERTPLMGDALSFVALSVRHFWARFSPFSVICGLL